jgi:type II secretory pathway component PulJ
MTTDAELEVRDDRVIERLTRALLVLEQDRMAAVERANECTGRLRSLRKAIAEERWGDLRGILSDAEIESLSGVSPSIWEEVEDEVESALQGD